MDGLDDIILSNANARWRKVALVMALTNDRIREIQLDASLDEIAERIKALVRTGRLESQGNLDRWRHSEVRLPAPDETQVATHEHLR